ncbi:MAG: neutral/alkaline non-lysosomal ceramidase N-terminal domain-containing protein, partial [Planctomycetota bacterium]
MRWPVWLGVTVLFGLLSGRLVSAVEPTWKAGTARIVITPQEPLWMAGFASRNHPAEGKLHDLWIKILVLEAADGHRGLIVTSDVCGISKTTYDAVCGDLEKRCGLARPQIKFTYSHTHSGPALRECLEDYYSWDDAARNRVTRYTLGLEKAVVDAVA